MHAWKNRGNALLGLARFDDAAAAAIRRSRLDPDDAGTWANRGEILRRLGRLDDAFSSTDRALSINSKIPEAWLARASILLMKGKVADSQAGCQTHLRSSRTTQRRLPISVNVMLAQGDAEAAVSWFDRALAIKPDDEVALSNWIFTLDFLQDGDFAHTRRRDRSGGIGSASKIAAQHPPRHDNELDPNKRIVLGYVSADFRHHSAAYAFRPVLENHDKTQFEVICYSSTPSEDAVTDSFRQVADRWRNALQWSDDRLADCIRADKVDILIDLSGHTDGNRLRVFARKPAPIQVTAWGHSTGTGLPTIDYLFSDPVAIPAEVRPLFAERVYDLPSVVIVEPPPADLRCPEPPVTANGYLTYGVFNRVSKLSNAAIGIWARILHSDATSRLLIKHSLIDDASIQRMLLEKFSSRGIATGSD